MVRVSPEARIASRCDTSAVPKRVLVVDDHAGFRHQTRLLLEEAGYEVVGEACDADAALLSARRLRPDLVLLDVQLPDGNGFELSAALTADDAPPVVVLVSGRDAADDPSRLRACGAQGFIAKSELSPELLDVVLARGPA